MKLPLLALSASLSAVAGAVASASLFVPLVPVFATPAAPTSTASTDTNAAFSRPLQGDKRFTHVLNRLAFGPRPGDVENLKQIGLRNWIETQMSPAKIDDSALETRLSSLKWLRESPENLQLAYESDTAGFIRKMRKTAETPGANAPGANAPGADAPGANAPGADDQGAMTTPLTPKQEELLARVNAAAFPTRSSVQALGELTTDKLARAIESNRQLQEVLTDFWGNHFNVDVKKGPVRTYKIVDDREVIRPHVFGTFRELLGASAHSPAMLWYLDNAKSTREYGALRAAKPGAKPRGGLNENYGRELMELHTLGVDGGYTQADVTEVARCFTGWGVDPQSGTFLFRPRAHDDGEKTVLGQKINEGGEADGEKVLDLLAKSPATAHFIARELCQRFVADAPPGALVERVAQAFLKSNGDLPTTYRALFYAPEFLSEGAYRAKIKSPLEFSVSAVRALGGTLQWGEADGVGGSLRLIALGGASLKDGGAPAGKKAAKRPLGSEISAMGQPLFSCQPPTGYSENSASWVSSSALVARLNFAVSLTEGRIGDVVLAEDTFRPATVDQMAAALLGSDLSASTRQTVENEAKAAPGDGAKLRALLLGSPDFQRR